MLHIIFNTTLAMTFIGGVLSIIILMFKTITMNLFSKTWNYYVALIAIVFFIVPLGLFTKEMGIQPRIDAILSAMSSMEIFEDNQNFQENTHLDLEEENLYYWDLQEEYESKLSYFKELTSPLLFSFSYVWLLGAGIFLVYKGGGFLKFKHKLLKTSLLIEEGHLYEEFQRYKRKVGIEQKVVLLSNDNINTPMLIGVFKPYLILPEVEMNNGELNIVLQHEFVHLKRKDLWFKTIVLLANTIHWFNPLVHKIVNHIEELCELSCDEQVVKNMDIEERRFYGETILNVLHRVVEKQEGICTSLCDTKKGIERRLLFIMEKKKVSKIVMVISIGVGTVLLMTGMMFAHKITPSLETSEMQAESIIGLNGENEENEEKGNIPLEQADENKEEGQVISMDEFFQELSQKQNIVVKEENIKELMFPIATGVIVSPYGVRTHPVTGESMVNTGIDIAGEEGSDIVAAMGGEVIATQKELNGSESYGNYVIIAHEDGTASLYAHCSKLTVEAGDMVEKGDKIAEVGSTGYATGPHCHFELRVNGEAVDPMPYMEEPTRL